MSFRRLPFQFTAVNPSERQAEIRKRFGLSNPSDMILDLENSTNMGAGNRDSNSATSSPRLQHRVPVFVEDPDPWISEKSRSNNVDNGRKPNVRVIPIEYEGDRKPVRQRNFSGPAGIQQNNSVQDGLVENDIKPVKHTMSTMTLPNRKRVPSGETKPRVYNIPIQIEKRENCNEHVKKPNLNSSPKEVKPNGCKVTKTSSENELQKSEEKIPEPGFKLQLKKVEDVLDDLKSYASGVESFSGTANDKQYRYLDEMLTRLMLRLDDIETMGNSDVRNARKAAIKKVQSYIDLLETKINSDSVEKDAESAIASGDIKESDKLDIVENSVTPENDMPESSTEHVELQEVPEIEMTEANVTEVGELVEHNKTDLDHHEAEKEPETQMMEGDLTYCGKLECNKTDSDHHETEKAPEIEMIEGYATSEGKSELLTPTMDVPVGSKLSEADMNDQTNSCKDLELSHSSDSNKPESQPEVEMVFVGNLEPLESCDKDRQVTNDTVEMKEASSQKTLTGIDMVESSEKSQDVGNNDEQCAQSLNDNCDIEMLDCTSQNIEENTETMLDCSLIIPENASHSDMLQSNVIKTAPTEILDEGSAVTTSNHNSELLRPKVDKVESKLSDFADNNDVLNRTEI
ncbi:BAG domain-containing protein Samui-like [Uloborus diversus]|uniref:BAG domain-containing protein Samui-like n=1 Tax=Uloborus diversus TaxID=327109 RepID=UPI00240A5C22|nr:BAG domain-containing protein Samui-like [Uloborus diversus]